MGSHYTRVPVASRNPFNMQSASGGWDFHTVLGGIDPEVIISGLLDLYMYGRNSDPGMGSCPPRVVLALRTAQVRFPYRAGRYRPWRPLLSSPVC